MSAVTFRQTFDRPNWVSSRASDSKHKIAPLDSCCFYMRSHIKDVVLNLPNTILVSETDNYLHFTFSTYCCKFIDDVEFFIDYNKGIVEVQSASRAGYYDFGVNRQRIENIRKLLILPTSLCTK